MKSLLCPVVLLASCVAPPASMASARWQIVETGSEASLRGLCVVDAETVWASGSGGEVLLTTDGGQSWTRSVVPGGQSDLRDVHAFDERTAYLLAITGPASIWRTTDGGEIWQELYRHPHPEAFLDSFTFFEDHRACVFGDPLDGVFQVLCSEPGGGEWARVPSANLPPPNPGEAAFAASGTCLASHGKSHAWIATGGLTARVLFSTDGARSWSAASTPMLAGESTTGSYSVAFRDERHGVLVGGDYTVPEGAERNAAFTDDGGRTWRLANTLPRGHRAGVAYVPDRARTLVAVGRAGTDYSEDDGRTWLPFSDEGFYAVGFAPSGEGWAVGADGKIARIVFGER